MTSFDKLHDSYELLEEADQLILRVLSVIYEPVNQTTINKVLTDVYQLDEHYSLLDLNMDKETRYRLEARGLIVVQAGKLMCGHPIVEWLTIQAVFLDEFAGILGAALSHVPLEEEYRHYLLGNNPKDDRRELRYALYGGKTDAVFECLQITDPYQKPSLENSHILVDICATPMHGDWFATLPIAIRFQILQPILETSLINWADSTVFYGLLNDMAGALDDPHPALKELIAEQRLYRGDWQSLNQYLAPIGTRQAEQLKACLQFFQGDTAESLAGFQQVITRTRKETRKRNVAIPGMSGVVYLLALLKDQDPGNSKLAEQQFKFVSNQAGGSDYYNEMLVLDRIRKISEGKQAFNSDTFDLQFSFYPPLTTLINGLGFLWNNHKPGRHLVTDLEKKSASAKDAGYLWLANECNQLLARLDKKTDKKAGKKAGKNAGKKEYKPEEQWGPPLTEVIPSQEDWERSLKALINVPATSKKGRKTNTGAELMRLAWLLQEDYEGFHLKPKEQKQKKNGRWSVGRSIALKRLLEEPDSYHYLTEADKKICRCIRAHKEYNHYGYSKTVYSLSNLKALIAAEGHPHLFRASDPSLMVNISNGTPELQVIEQGNDISLSLVPYPHGENYLISEESPGRYRIYQYSAELQHIGQILGEQGLLVPGAAREKVLESVSAIAPLLTIHSDVEGISDQHAEFIEADPRTHIHLQPMASGLRLNFQVQPFTAGPVLIPGRGGESIFAEIDGKQLQTKRDLTSELERLKQVVAACDQLVEVAPNDWCWEETEDALEGLLTLQSLGDEVVLSWPEGKEIKLGRTVGVGDMSVSLRQKTDWFKLDGELKADNQQVYSMQALLELIATSNSRFIELADGQFLTLTTELRKRLEELGSYTNKQQVHSLNAINLEASIEGMEVDADKAWDQFRGRLQNARDLMPEIPSTLQADLRDYQVQGYNWLCRLSEWGAGACLADDMGLGKTLQALALVVSRAAVGPTLVLAPTSVCTNWIDEAIKFAPTLKPILFGAGNRKETLNNLKPYDLLICSYGLLQSEAKSIQATHWTTIIADEAQAFKNAATKRSKSVMELKGDFKMIATGTPIENHLGELWNLFQFINPGLLGSREMFNNRFAYPIENQKDTSAASALRSLISPFILRRLKRDVLKELPPRTEITLRVDLSKEEAALYEALRLEAVTQMQNVDLKPNEQRIRALASITKLRRAVCNPNMVLRGADLPSAKLEIFQEVVHELLQNKHKALVFSQFVEHLTLIRARLDKLGISYQYLDGSTPLKKRAEAVNAFQSGDGDLFLISLKAGGVGLNLTAADYVIHMDPWWNPAVEDQASDRAHRIGQQRPVTVYRIVANNTIEEKIVELHAQKRDLADRLLEGSEISAKMSLDDMLQLIV